MSSSLRVNLIKLHVFWKTNTQKLHSISDLAGIFGTEKEVVAFALKVGKGWIDTQPAVKDLDGTQTSG